MLANRTFGQVNCCMDGGLSACNQPGYPDRALTMTGHFATIVNGKPSLGTLMFELAAGRPRLDRDSLDQRPRRPQPGGDRLRQQQP